MTRERRRGSFSLERGRVDAVGSDEHAPAAGSTRDGSRGVDHDHGNSVTVCDDAVSRAFTRSLDSVAIVYCIVWLGRKIRAVNEAQLKIILCSPSCSTIFYHFLEFLFHSFLVFSYNVKYGSNCCLIVFSLL